MKSKVLFFILLVFFSSCKPGKDHQLSNQSLTGTWKLISSTVITKKDTVHTYPVKGQEVEMLKLFNGSHFAFFKHDLKKGAVASPVYDSGAGTYSLSGNNYEEHLAYCNYRDWENTSFKFTLDLKNDTLIQRGIEKIDSLNVNQEIIETYIKLR